MIKNSVVMCLCLATLAFQRQALAASTLSFSGYTWAVKSSSGKVGPGPNYFSNNSNNVWVDSAGRLHLKITKQGARWYCAEVVSAASFGYGTYRWYFDTPLDALDPNVVLGLFTWDDAPDYAHREIDIEFSRWGAVKNLNAQYVVQPYNTTGHLFRFNEPAGLLQSTHSFEWLPGSASFMSIKGLNATPPTPADLIEQWSYSANDVPVAGGENARMNLWLNQGRHPLNNQASEVIIDRFEFVAYAQTSASDASTSDLRAPTH